jgi:hypothetical protein
MKNFKKFKSGILNEIKNFMEKILISLRMNIYYRISIIFNESRKKTGFKKNVCLARIFFIIFSRNDIKKA